MGGSGSRRTTTVVSRACQEVEGAGEGDNVAGWRKTLCAGGAGGVDMATFAKGVGGEINGAPRARRE